MASHFSRVKGKRRKIGARQPAATGRIGKNSLQPQVTNISMINQ
jgi:hypothetical protein